MNFFSFFPRLAGSKYDLREYARSFLNNFSQVLIIFLTSTHSHYFIFVSQGGSMPNTSSTSVPFLLSSSMQSIRSRRTSTVLSSGPLNSGSGLLSELRSGMVRMAFNPPVTSSSASPLHQHYNNGNKNFVRKCPSLNITFSN